MMFPAADALLGVVRDREVLHHVLAGVAGDSVAEVNESATGKVKRGVVRDCFDRLERTRTA